MADTVATAAINAGAAAVTLATKIQEQVNSDAMKKASSAAKDQEVRSGIAQHVNEEKTDAVRKDLAI